jgi:AcrR family transcriptional regulator
VVDASVSTRGRRPDAAPSGDGLVPQRDAERTRTEILDVATREFADRGYNGARVDEIATKTRTTKRMIYYYFGSKEQLYIAVLERVYQQIRTAEQTLDVDGLDPVDAIRRIAELTFDHHQSHPDFIRLVSIENINRAEHMAKSPRFPGQNASVLSLIEQILARGRAQGRFRREVDALDVHMLISSYCVFRVANRHTFNTIFGRDLADPALADRYRTMLGDLVVAYLTELDDDDP